MSSSTTTTPSHPLPKDKTQTTEQAHRSLIRQYNYVLKALYFGVLTLSCLLPPFDASAQLVSTSFPASAALRWDAFHFLHTAQHGYMYEHEWAFLPGVSFLMRFARFLHMQVLGRHPTVQGTLWPAIGAAMAVDSSQLVYSLSLHHLKSPDMALLATLLSLIPTSPMTLLFAPYNEPFFTHLSLRGMLCCTRKDWTRASLWFALACLFRSNGIFLSGYIIWGLVAQQIFQGRWPGTRALLKSITLTALIFTPFLSYQAYAYSVFCTPSKTSPSRPLWCTNFPPSIYSYVQAKYWDVGFLRYWTPAQIPNFLIATPSLVLIGAFAVHHLRHVLLARVNGARRPAEKQVTDATFLNASITPHAIHALVLGFIILFMSHTQIILRLAASLPLIHWAAAWLMMEHPFWGRLWVFWSVLWGTISPVLWATFLPPA